jgi:ribonuclease P protein component
VFPFRVYYLISQGPNLAKSGSGLQFGVGVSKRNFNSAVDRNRIKRLTRESYRLQKQVIKQHVLEGNKCLSLFFIFTAKELPAYAAVYEKMQVILKRLILITDENNINPA